jgi:cell division initiation protein
MYGRLCYNYIIYTKKENYIMTQEQIESKEFKKGLFGFNKDEVNNFKREVAAEIGELNKKVNELKEKNDKAEKANNESAVKIYELEKQLEQAAPGAKKEQNAANAEANKIVNDAKKKANEVLANAKAELAKLREEMEELKGKGAGASVSDSALDESKTSDESKASVEADPITKLKMKSQTTEEPVKLKMKPKEEPKEEAKPQAFAGKSAVTEDEEDDIETLTFDEIEEGGHKRNQVLIGDGEEDADFEFL